MAERLIIDNFAGIQHLELNLKEINILIGPQAVGKSICAKLLYYFRGFVRDLSSNTDGSSKPIADFAELRRAKFAKYFSSSAWSAGDFRVRYEIDNAFMEVHRSSDPEAAFRLDYSKFFDTELAILHKDLSELRSEATEVDGDDHWEAEFFAKARHSRRMRDKLGDGVLFRQVFIPAGRSFFAYLQQGMFSLMQGDYAVDPFVVEFGSFYERIQSTGARKLRQRSRESAKQISESICDILCGESVRRKEGDFIVMNDGRVVSIASSSSGQQEMLPLAVVLEFLASPALRGLGYGVCIEEPEAHLFPTSQRRVVELLSMVFDKAGRPLQLVITTHSPYILTAFNNLMQAGSLAKTLPKKRLKELDAIVPAPQRLDPDVVAAYLLEGGSGRSIIDPDTGLISAELIDRVSDDLSIQFDKLLDLE